MMRECGGCTLCCKLLPVPPLDKKAGERCRFVRTGKGCSVHHTPKQPRECGLWHCRWLVNDEAGDLPRPDRAHYVIDIMPDEMVISDDETGFRQTLAAIQIWCDPAHRDEIMRDAKLRAWIARKAEQGIPDAAALRHPRSHRRVRAGHVVRQRVALQGRHHQPGIGTVEMIELIVMRLANMKRVHPDQISDSCSQCGHVVAVYPSGQAVMREHPSDVVLICDVCRPQPGPRARLAPGAALEPFQSRKK
jgi:hypothetical protein